MRTTPLSENVCPVCGTPLPPHATAEQCPKCLLQAGLTSQPAAPDPQADPDRTVASTGSSSASHAWPETGQLFGHYRIVRLLGQGGMGAVFEAEDIDTDRRVALKVLSQALDSPEARQRFFREGRLAASINHPNSVYVFGTEEIGGTPVIAMELVPGGTLQERVTQRGPLPVEAAVDAILQVIAGLDAARLLGILHRDIKPSNCFEDADGTIKVGDFGLSISTVRTDLNLTTAGVILGTPAFSSPEQLRGEELTLRSDLYAVGVTLFYLLTGRTPYQARNTVQLIASVLEQPAPSPKTLRPSIPQELANVVLRCLQKQPSDRFKNYDELRQALAPFGSMAPAPAPLGLRFVAGTIDVGLIGLGGFTACLAIFGEVFPFQFTMPARNEQLLPVVVASFTAVLLYYALLEGLWGASIGKRICRLRVVGPDRNPPGIRQALLRAVIFQLIPVLPYWVSFGVNPTKLLMSGNAFVQYGLSLLYYAIVAGLFSTARRRNGFAAVQDLATGTRVIRQLTFQPRPSIAQKPESIPLSDAAPRVGPYHVLETIESRPDSQWLLGYDTRLLRKVWLHLVPAGTPPVPSSQRNLGRVGRLRWIGGCRSAEAHWDAYEAATGQPLLRLNQQRQPWAHVRFWLLDLATELSLAENEGTVPKVLALDRVWITAEGRAKLLDFPAPGLGEHSPAATESVPHQAPHAQTPAGEWEGGSPPVLGASLGTAHFLHEVAHASLEGRTASSLEKGEGISAPLPLSARDFLSKLTTQGASAWVLERLRSLVQQVPTVSRMRRFGVVAGCALFPLVVGIVSFFGPRALERMNQRQPDIWELNQLLAVRASQRAPWVKHQVLDDRLIGIYIASHYAATITNSDRWLNPYALSMVQGEGRKFAERSVIEHANPTLEEIDEAEAAVTPLMDRMLSNNILQRPWFPFVACGISWIVYVAIPALLAALLFRGGLVLRALRLAVMRSDGAPASRLRVFWRSLVSWSVVLIAPFAVGFLNTAMGMTGAIFVVAVVWVVLALWSVFLPERGLQDRLARTVLVMR